jgi:succinyl-CoA synthetase beta subunit
VRCDLIAEGIIRALREVDLQLPVVVRLEGTNVMQGRELLAQSGLEVRTADDLAGAAQQAVMAADSA